MSPWPFCERAYPTVFNTPNAKQESPLAPVHPTTDGLIEGKREGRVAQLDPIWYVVGALAILIGPLLYVNFMPK